MSRSSKKVPSCEDCYFRQKMLCALDLEGPCGTFRESRPEGLVPPRQPMLLLRRPVGQTGKSAPANQADGDEHSRMVHRAPLSVVRSSIRLMNGIGFLS